MNTKILQKCLELLESDKPDLSRVKGMLETYIDLYQSLQQPTQQYSPVTITSSIPTPQYYKNTNQDIQDKIDEEHNAIEDAYLRGTISPNGLQ